MLSLGEPSLKPPASAQWEHNCGSRESGCILTVQLHWCYLVVNNWKILSSVSVVAVTVSTTSPKYPAKVLMAWVELHLSVSWFTPSREGNKQGSYKEEGRREKSSHSFNKACMPGPVQSWGYKRYHSCSVEFKSRWGLFGRASCSRNNPQAGPSTSNGESGWPSRKVGGYLGSGSPGKGPELKIFLKVAYQEVLPRETHGMGQRRSDKCPIARKLPWW